MKHELNGIAGGIQWPPRARCWLRFLFEARVLVSSHKRFQCLVGNVNEVADRLWRKTLGVCTEDIDPGQL